jgi:hypothetical protein
MSDEKLKEADWLLKNGSASQLKEFLIEHGQDEAKKMKKSDLLIRLKALIKHWKTENRKLSVKKTSSKKVSAKKGSAKKSVVKHQAKPESKGRETLPNYWPNEAWNKQKIKSWLTERDVELPREDKPKEYYLTLFDNYQDTKRYTVWFVGFDHSSEDSFMTVLREQNQILFRVVDGEHLAKDFSVDFAIHSKSYSDLVYIEKHLGQHGIMSTWDEFEKNVLI